MKDLTRLSDRVAYVGVNDRTKHLFEGLWSLPCGVSYNAYVVKGADKTALIDTVDAAFTEQLLENVADVLGDRRPDYLVINHMEPDHSASIRAVRRVWPELTIVGNAKTLRMLEGYYGICERTLEVKEGSTIDLGGCTLVFSLIPMVHWPETMVTWCPEERTLFSGDAFGTFGALDGGVTDAELSLDDFRDEMRRYYACIVGKYGAPVQAALRKLAGLPVETICSTHGPVWRREAADVVALYDRMSRYATEPGVVIAYGSMYGNTERMAEAIARGLAAEGVKPIRIYNLSTADQSVVLRDVFRYDTLVVGSPTYNGELYPPVAALLRKLSERNLPPRRFAAFGGYTWASAAVRHLNAWAEGMKWTPLCTPVELMQGFSGSCAACCRELAHAVAQRD